MNAVTLVEEGVFRTYRFSTIIKQGCCPEFTEYLDYAHQAI